MVEVVAKGSILVKVDVKGEVRKIKIKYMYADLFSVNKLVIGGLNVQFNMMECVMKVVDSKMVAMTL